jgi:hypothetical protein
MPAVSLLERCRGQRNNASQRADNLQCCGDVSPLVEPESVVFGNTVPIKVLGHGPLPTPAKATQSDEP